MNGEDDDCILSDPDKSKCGCQRKGILFLNLRDGAVVELAECDVAQVIVSPCRNDMSFTSENSPISVSYATIGIFMGSRIPP